MAKTPKQFKPKTKRGRPKGSTKISITDGVKRYLHKHPEKYQELVEWYVNNKKIRDLLWKMIDGNPTTKNDVSGRVTVVKLDKTIAQKYNVTTRRSKKNSK